MHTTARRVSFILALVLLTAPLAPAAAAPLDLTCSQQSLPGWGGFTTQVCANHPLTVRNEAITTAFIVIMPGDNNTGFGVWPAVVFTGRNDAALVLAPTLSENPTADPNVLYWHPNWRFGGNSANGPTGGVGAFAVSDALIDIAANRDLFPNLKRIVVTGFSAGGQYANRYAVLNQHQQQVQAAAPAIEFRYVVGSPSIYVYLDGERYDPASGAFQAPTTSGCYGFHDDYPYGLEGNGFVSDLNLVRSQYANRQVVYLAGQLDNNPSDPSLTGGCMAGLQGAHRLERTRWYFAHIQDHYGVGQVPHFLLEVPNVGHSTAVYSTPQGHQALFGDWTTPSTIAGRVTDHMGLPVAGVQVHSTGGSAATGADGRYSLLGLLPGAYTLDVPLAGRTSAPTTRAVTLPPAATGQDFSLLPVLQAAPERGQAGSAFSVTATGASPGMSFDVLVNGQKVGTATSTAGGALAFQLQTGALAQPGVYLVVIAANIPSAVVFVIDPAAALHPAAGGPPVLSVPASVSAGTQLFLALARR